jgi:hypothetical protein
MATPRKRSSGFSEKPKEEISEEAQLSEFLEEVATEMFETISHKEDAPPEPEQVEKNFVAPSITPTEDPGPRFMPEPEPVSVYEPSKSTVPLRQNRHPRNIPKFSPHRKP